VTGTAVYVDPGRVRELAQALDGLVAALGAEAPVISGGLGGWGSRLDCGPLRGRIGALRSESATMWKRFTLALVAENQGSIRPAGHDPLAGMWSIGWNPTPEQLAAAGAVLAGSLSKAMADDPQDPIVRRRLADIGVALRHGKDDAAFNASFYANGGAAAAASVARFLHVADGTHGTDPLSAGSDAIVADFAAGVAATSAMVADGRIRHGEHVLDALVHPAGDDFWSVGMLFARGPEGTAYGKAFLADLGRSVLDWRSRNPDAVTYFHSEVVSKYPVPSGFIGAKGSWYDELGLRPDYLSQGAERQRSHVDALLANDPARNVLGVLGQNAAASTALLGGENGLRYARQLLDPRWAVPGTGGRGDEPAARVIRAGTVPRDLGAGAELRTQAAANVFQAAEQVERWLHDPNRSEPDRTDFPSLPGDLTRALGATTRTYLYDLAASTENFRTAADSAVLSDGAYLVQSDEDTVTAVLKLVYGDRDEWIALEGALDAQVAAAALEQAQDPKEAAKEKGINQLAWFGGLAGLMAPTGLGREYAQITTQSEKEARNATMVKILVNSGVDAMAAGLGANPATLPLGIAMAAAAPSLTERLPSGSPADYTSIEDEIRRGQERFQLPVAQGLISSGHLDAPVGRSWFRGGYIRIQDDEEAKDFEKWWTTRGEDFTDYEMKARFPYNDATAAIRRPD
jgi:hypothetical protein